MTKKTGPGEQNSPKCADLAATVFVLEQKIQKLSTEVDELQQKINLLKEYERLRDIVVVNKKFVNLRLPKFIHLDARDFFDLSEGFYFLEYGDAGNAYRWSGPDHFSRIRLDIDRTQPIKLLLNLYSLGKNGPNDPLAVDVDGVAFPLFATPDGRHHVAGPFPIREEAGPTDFLIHVPVLFSPLENGENDPRRLGIAIASLEVVPAT